MPSDGHDPSDLRIKVGVHEDPVDAVKKILGADAGERAIRLQTDDGRQFAHFGLLDGELWGVVEVDGQEEPREGPVERENVMSGLATADSVEVVTRSAAPFEDEMRGGPGV